jgi:hypothetical protein
LSKQRVLVAQKSVDLRKTDIRQEPVCAEQPPPPYRQLPTLLFPISGCCWFFAETALIAFGLWVLVLWHAHSSVSVSQFLYQIEYPSAD